MKAPNPQRRKKTVYRSRRLTRIMKVSILASVLAASASVAQGQQMGEPTECWANCHSEATEYYNNSTAPTAVKQHVAQTIFDDCLQESLCS